MSNNVHSLKIPEGMGMTALITGASSGLGKAFAEVFASEGFDVVLVARRENQLRELANELEKRFDIKAHVVASDLVKPDAAQQIFDTLADREIEVDALVNNAGFATPGFYQETDWQVHQDMIQLMVTVPAQLSYLFEPGMVKRGYGRIINVSSFAGLVEPSGGYTLYSGIKSYLVKFSQAHAAELKGTGVNILALCPGFFKSELKNGGGKKGITANLPPTAFLEVEDVAREGYDAVMKGEEVVHVNGRLYRIIQMWEKSVAAKQMRKTGKLSSYADRHRTDTTEDNNKKTA